MDPEIKAALDEMQKAWSEFKKANDARLSAIEAKGYAPADLEGKVEKLNAALTASEKRVNDLETKNARPNMPAVDEVAGRKAAEKKAFEAFIRTGTKSEALASGSVGTAAQGGVAVPEDFDRQLGEILRNATPMRSVCNVIRTATEDYVKVYSLGGAGSGWVGETDARGETNAPQLAKLTPVYGEVYANAYATQKLLDDSAFNVDNWFLGEISKAFAAAENNKFTATDATGTNSPKGLLAYTMAATADSSRTFGQLEKLVTAANNAFTADELIDLVHKLKAAYRSNAIWMMPTATVAICRKFKDATSGQYLWQPGLGGDVPAKLLGYPVVENEDFPAFAATKPIIAFGDFKAGYTIADVGTNVQIRDIYTVTPYIRFYVSKRVGGFVSDSNAIKILYTKT